MQHVNGTFDLLLDFGAFYDLSQEDRDAYMDNIMPLIRPGGLLLLLCFEKGLPLSEVQHRFVERFDIDTIARKPERIFGRERVIYLMTTK